MRQNSLQPLPCNEPTTVPDEFTGPVGVSRKHFLQPLPCGTGSGSDGIPGPTGPAGPAGPTGPAGPPGPVENYRHVQGVPSSVWTINHNLGFYPAGVTVRDSAGDLRFGSVEYLDINTVTISFFESGVPVGFSGEAFLS